MDFMMYMPKLDDDTKVIIQRIERLGFTGYGGDESDSRADAAYEELAGMGKFIASHLLNAWERPPQRLKDRYFNGNLFYSMLNKLIVHMIERGDLSLPQLQRYRRLITSEKL